MSEASGIDGLKSLRANESMRRVLELVGEPDVRRSFYISTRFGGLKDPAHKFVYVLPGCTLNGFTGVRNVRLRFRWKAMTLKDVISAVEAVENGWAEDD